MGPEQARIMLQLGLNAGYSLEDIRKLFEDPIREAIYAPRVNQLAFY